MLYWIDNDHLKVDKTKSGKATPEKSYLYVLSFEELTVNGSGLGINEKFISECIRDGVPKFESYDGFDFLSLNILDDTDQRRPPERVCVYLTRNLLAFVCTNNQVVNALVTELQEKGLKNISHGRILHLFLDRLTYDDALVLEAIEQEIADLEEELMRSKKCDFANNIITLRKKLLSLKRYYEQLLEISEEIEQNENEFIDKKTLRYFRMITGRVDRLYHGVLNLRDYVTQVREAYQAQIDIDLNSIMKIFTVITSIFLPLTLIVGWYGMNLKMPEFGWDYGYLFVIGISIAAATSAVIYFKKKKWF